MSTGKRYITKVALEDCNLVEEFKAVTCENCRKVREYVNVCDYHLLVFFVLFLGLENDKNGQMIKDTGFKTSSE